MKENLKIIINYLVGLDQINQLGEDVKLHLHHVQVRNPNDEDLIKLITRGRVVKSADCLQLSHLSSESTSWLLELSSWESSSTAFSIPRVATLKPSCLRSEDAAWEKKLKSCRKSSAETIHDWLKSS